MLLRYFTDSCATQRVKFRQSSHLNRLALRCHHTILPTQSEIAMAERRLTLRATQQPVSVQG